MLKSSVICNSLRKAQKSHAQIVAKLSTNNNKSESYTERQNKLGRHVSPHVEIYKFPPAALSSITNRITGVALTAGFTGIAGVALVGGDPSALMSCIGDSAVGVVAKFAVAFPFVFHYLGGIRHIAWDRDPELLTSEQVEKSSYILFGSAAVLSAGLAFVSI